MKKEKNEKTQKSKECPLQGICVLYSKMNKKMQTIATEYNFF